jgi:hypothetical protein
MPLLPGSRVTVTIQNPAATGTAWIVRVYLKGVFRKKLISSDWFLDPAQAESFAIDIRETLSNVKGLDLLRRRPPGWSLKRPAR